MLREEIRSALTKWSNLKDVLARARSKTSSTPMRTEVELRPCELTWLIEHFEKIKQYQNQWIAIEGDRIIAQGTSEEEVDRQARSQGIVSPFVIYIPSENEVPFIGGIS